MQTKLQCIIYSFFASSSSCKCQYRLTWLCESFCGLFFERYRLSIAHARNHLIVGHFFSCLIQICLYLLEIFLIPIKRKVRMIIIFLWRNVSVIYFSVPLVCLFTWFVRLTKTLSLYIL